MIMSTEEIMKKTATVNRIVDGGSSVRLPVYRVRSLENWSSVAQSAGAGKLCTTLTGQWLLV
ncbi:hypothetical protein PGT21_002566 [Puccinia graminis f. sp. tritici]|uniref:Uncharacterized protein n=1 Tax=Puccinia graminis f. sp. tritici TaxID=56615 RepID=A0A5B0P1I8_PUCGR|nr:hypothetical protein PGT21_002566 [Puccinia graminis f. sp. tritici]